MMYPLSNDLGPTGPAGLRGNPEASILHLLRRIARRADQLAVRRKKAPDERADRVLWLRAETEILGRRGDAVSG